LALSAWKYTIIRIIWPVDQGHFHVACVAIENQAFSMFPNGYQRLHATYTRHNGGSETPVNYGQVAKTYCELFPAVPKIMALGLCAATQQRRYRA